MKFSRVIIGFLILVIATFFISGCTKSLDSKTVMVNLEDYSLYPKVIEHILPDFNIMHSENKPYYILNDGGIVEVFDTQAAGAISTKIAKYWYPHYLATAIIAVDRDQTDEVILSWSDLYDTKKEVGFNDFPGNLQMITAAMAYGLEGKDYTLEKTMELLSFLYDKGQLKINSYDTPIMICFDSQATTLVREGRNLEIIVPNEGTFTYEKGLLSNEQLEFEGNINTVLNVLSLRTLENTNRLDSYPKNEAYSQAVNVMDYDHFATTTKNINCLLERKVYQAKRFMSIDHREHIHYALIYLIVITLWVSSVIRRSMQKAISYAAMFTGIILIGWILVRLIKYQTDVIPSLNRYLWYSYYIFQLTLPMVILWMAWAIDKPKEKIFPPRWWRTMAIFIGVLIVFVFTNDLHGLMFELDLSKPDWAVNYTYGIGYYLVLFVCMLNLSISFIILVIKSIKSPRKKRFIFPLSVFVLFGIYNYHYIARNPFIYETDVTIITGIFTMLMFESSIQSGLIPVNTKYIPIFLQSPLRLQIINKNRKTILASSGAVPLNSTILDQALKVVPEPVLNEDSLLFANTIPGGFALWQEDISKLYQLHMEIANSTNLLRKANEILAQDEKLKRRYNEEKAKKMLMEQLENEIADGLTQLSSLIEQLSEAKNQSMEITSIALLLCYIKRRCDLFFQQKEGHSIAAQTLTVYMLELEEIAELSSVQIATLNYIVTKIAIRYATLFYDVYFGLISQAVMQNVSSMVIHLEESDDLVSIGFLLPKAMDQFVLEHKLSKAIAHEKGRIMRKDLGDTFGISLSFPRRGGLDE